MLGESSTETFSDRGVRLRTFLILTRSMALLLGVFLLIYATLHPKSFFPNLSIFVGMGAFMLCGWWAKRLRDPSLPAMLLCIVGLATIPIRVLATGGPTSPGLLWFPFIPLLATSFISIRAAVVVTAITVVEVVGSMIAVGYFADSLPIHQVTPGTGTRVLGQAAAITFVSVILIYLQWQRHRWQVSIKEQHDKLIKTSKSTALGNMSMGIAHEIRSPLAIIRGYASLLSGDLEGSGKTPEELGGLIKNHCSRIEDIIRGLRSLTKSGDTELRQDIDVDDVVREVRALYGKSLSSDGIELILPSGSTAKVTCQRGQLIQVLINLINNAADAIRESDSQTGRRWIRVDVQDMTGFVEISVSDSGPGIPPEHRAMVLDPFFTTKAEQDGTGLGLNICNQIIRRHGGQLWLDEDAAETRFVFTVSKDVLAAAS